MEWLHIPCLESNSSQAPECLEKDCEPGSTIWASRIAPFATLSGKLTQPASWLRAWKKSAWMRHLSGPMSPPSTQEDGVEKWIASLPDSRARTCQLLGGAQGLTGNAADFSSRLHGSQLIAMRGSCFWRTSQASLLPPPPLWTRKKANSTNARPPASWENWPTSGGTRNGLLYQRPMWEPATAGQDGSVLRGENWLTPHGMSGMEEATGKRGAGGEFAAQASHWMTPCVPNGGRSVSAEVVSSKGMTENGKRTVGLESQVRHVWSTPNAHDGRRPGADLKSTQGANLNRDAATWPTPASRDHKGTNSLQHMNMTDGRTDGRTEQESCRSTTEFHHDELFAPGPSNPRWTDIIREHPELAPALEPTFHQLVNGLAFDMDDCRAARLKCSGNGVVALQAALATVVLARRAGLA